MKALSIKQPWAFLIAEGIKDIENRSWRTNYRGRVFIHASAKNFPSFNFTEEQTKAIEHIPDSQKFENSAIIGEIDIVDCVINHPSIWAEKMEVHICPNTGVQIFEKGQNYIWNWVLANAVLYDKPILNIKGKLSFWEYNCCHICKQPVEPDCECRDCGELVCDKCSEPYNQFTQIDYTLCKTHRDG